MPPGGGWNGGSFWQDQSGIENFKAGLWTTYYVDEPVCQLPAGKGFRRGS